MNVTCAGLHSLHEFIRVNDTLLNHCCDSSACAHHVYTSRQRTAYQVYENAEHHRVLAIIGNRGLGHSRMTRTTVLVVTKSDASQIPFCPRAKALTIDISPNIIR